MSEFLYFFVVSGFRDGTYDALLIDQKSDRECLDAEVSCGGPIEIQSDGVGHGIGCNEPDGITDELVDVDPDDLERTVSRSQLIQL